MRSVYVRSSVRQPKTSNKRSQRPLKAGTLTRISAQRKNRNRASLYIDGSFAFGVMQSILLEFQLHSGMTLTVERQRAILDANAYLEARAAALELLSYKQRSEQELEERLIQKGYTVDVVTRTITRLRELKYLDDARFAVAFARERLNVNRYGRLRIRRDLQQRGISEPLIQEAINGLSDCDARAAALKAGQTLLKRSRSVNCVQKRRKRIYGSLTRRGFTAEITRSTLDALNIRADLSETASPAPQRALTSTGHRPSLSIEDAERFASTRWASLTKREPVHHKRVRKLKDALRRRGLSFEALQPIVDRVSADDFASDNSGDATPATDSDFETFSALAEKRWRRVRKLEDDPRKQRKKLSDYLRRQGADSDTIHQLVTSLVRQPHA